MTTLHINAIKGEVVVVLSEPCSWLSFTPDEARSFAEHLVKTADQASASGTGSPSPRSLVLQ